MSIILSPADRSDAVAVALHLREDDREELAASRGIDLPLVTLWECLERSEVSLTMQAEGQDVPVALLGFAPDPSCPDRALAWMLATAAVRAHGVSVVKKSRQVLDHFGNLLYPKGFYALAWEKNRTHRRFLDTLGFATVDVPPVVQNNNNFHWYSRPCVI